MRKDKVTRRDFLKKTGTGATGAAALVSLSQEQAQGADLDRTGLVSAMGDTLIPTDPGEPGYRTLEPYNITAEVLKGLRVSDEDLAEFDEGARAKYGRGFVELEEWERGEYFESVAEGGGKLEGVLMDVRRQVFTVYYGNYPEHAMARDNTGAPILAPGDQHQITNPNTKQLVTGWDVAGFMGPLSWEEEERRREIVKRIDWRER